MIIHIFCFVCFLMVASCQQESHEDELRNNLMKNYNSEALPNKATVVSLRISALHFTMNEKIQSLDLDCWISMEWKDPRLDWRKDSYKDITRLAFKRESLWHPDITLYNNAQAREMDIYANSDILVMSGGRVIWVPPAHIKASCVMDMTYWPYDIHNCTAKFGSWVHSVNRMDLKIKDDYLNMKDMELYSGERNLTRGEWKILSTNIVRQSKFYECCPEEYVNIQMSITLQRDAPGYAWTIQMPIVVLCLLTVIVFILPPSSGEKVLMGGIALVLDFFFLLAVSYVIQNSANHTPYLVELVGKQLILTSVSLIISSIILRLVRDPRSSGLPVFIRIPIIVMSSCLCLSGYRQTVTSSMTPFSRSSGKGDDLELNEGSAAERGIFTKERTGGSGEGEWLLLAAVIDRFCLIIFIVIFLIFMINFNSVL